MIYTYYFTNKFLEDMRNNINSEYKGLGETSLMMKAIEFINNNLLLKPPRRILV